MLKHKIKFDVDYGKVPYKSKTVPDQSMSIHELVRRFVKGIPADVEQRRSVYNPDNNEVDLEKLGRLDPADKAYEAASMHAQNEATKSEIKRLYDEDARTRKEEQREQREADQGKHDGSGIGSLDNTMPHDTGSDSQSVTRVKKSTKK